MGAVMSCTRWTAWIVAAGFAALTATAEAHVEAKAVDGEPVTFRDSSCSTPSDPINVVLVGDLATPENSAIHIREHTPAGGSSSGGAQFISSHGRCFQTQAAAKGDRGSEGTYHSRIWQNAADEYHSPRATINPIHHERIVTCNGRPNDAVFENDPEYPGRGGFDGGAARFWEGFNRNDGHRQVQVDEVPHKRTFKQCTGEVVGWNGRILWFSFGERGGGSERRAAAPRVPAPAPPEPERTVNPREVASRVVGAICSPEAGNRLAYWLGEVFETLPAAPAARVCQPAHPVNPALAANNYISFVYGTCSPPLDAAEARCLPPVEIQTAPLSERNRARYTWGGAPYPSTTITLQNAWLRHDAAVSYDGGRIIELYVDGVTISVFGNDPAQVRRAAERVQRVPRIRVDYPEPLHEPLNCGDRYPCHTEFPDSPDADQDVVKPPSVPPPAHTVEDALKLTVDPVLDLAHLTADEHCRADPRFATSALACDVAGAIP